MRQFDVAEHACVRGSVRSARLNLVALLAVVLGAGLLARAGLAEDVRASGESIENELGQVALVVSDDDRTLEFSGPIAFGVTRRVRVVLDAHPSITTVRLTSPGGRVVEARELSEVIARRGLTTVAVGNCASACTVLFMAGRERLLAPTSTLGFHRYLSPDPEQEEAEANMAIDRRYFRARGIPAWFVERAFATPNAEMWRPSLDEMRVANVVTGEMTGDGRRVALIVDVPQVAGALPEAAAPVDGGLSVNASEAQR